MDDCSTEPPRNTHEKTNGYILYTKLSVLFPHFWSGQQCPPPDLKQHVSVSQGIVPRLLTIQPTRRVDHQRRSAAPIRVLDIHPAGHLLDRVGPLATLYYGPGSKCHRSATAERRSTQADAWRPCHHVGGMTVNKSQKSYCSAFTVAALHARDPGHRTTGVSSTL